jgi:hypothetical protein
MKTTEKQLKSEMLKNQIQFDKLWTKIVKDINDYKLDNPQKNFYEFEHSEIETFIDDLCLSGAWIRDRLDNKTGSVHSTTYKKSLTKKIRKALDYTL